MSNPSEPLKVDPTELHVAADKLDGQASEFLAAHGAAHSRASQVRLGSGLASAALPQMAAAWEADSARFSKEFATNAEKHREAAIHYTKTDAAGADGIEDAGDAL